MPRHLSALRYWGGKNANSVSPNTNSWIRQMLPKPTHKQVYVETHAGMLGVLLSRPPAGSEIANDLNGRIVNWWRVVRDRTEEFKHKLLYTPRSRDEFNRAKDGLDEGDAIERALNMHIVLSQSLMGGDGESGSFAVSYGDGGLRDVMGFVDCLPALANRMRLVQLENKPATDILKRVANTEHAVIYVDPPYTSSSTSPYSVDQQDYEETLDLLAQQRGRVAVSGYGDEWDALLQHGWRRHEHQVLSYAPGGNNKVKRTEVLWLNYDHLESAPLLQYHRDSGSG